MPGSIKIKKSSALAGAAFLMATSAIGPGFLTQTSLFTSQLLASFGFVILISILLDIGAQLNIWRIIAVSETRAQDLANKLFPGLGFLLASLIAFGGLVFNIGNISGTGLGINVLTGLDVKSSSIISGIVALVVFWMGDAGRFMDLFVKVLGILMIAMTLYVVFSSHPPISEALYRTVWPQKIDAMKIVTLVGGTVGGYISFAGAHRLLDAEIKGRQQLKMITHSSVRGIIITSIMRYVLFLAALGVVMQGIKLDESNPAASVFQSAAGEAGYRFFGLVIWSASITSVIGASFTSVSFWKTLVPSIKQNERIIISSFIVLSIALFLLIGKPVSLLVWAGAVNGLILPVALTVILVAAQKTSIIKDYKHPLILLIAGWFVVFVMTWLGVVTIQLAITGHS